MIALDPNWTALHPEEAIAYLQRKLAVTPDQFAELARKYDVQAFTVSGLENERLLEATKKAIETGLQEGLTQRQIEAAINAEFDAAGVTQLNPFHLETVVRTNISQALNAGHREMANDPFVKSVLPYYQFLTVNDGSVRPEHQAWHERTWPKDDEATTAAAYRLLDEFNCRCEIISSPAPAGQ